MERTIEEDKVDGGMLLTIQVIDKEKYRALGPRARTILDQLLAEFTNKFIEASAHYGDSNAGVLGTRGQFADIWRKIGPLKLALWEGQELTREQPDEILLDLIGHCFLTLEMLRRDELVTYGS